MQMVRLFFLMFVSTLIVSSCNKDDGSGEQMHSIIGDWRLNNTVSDSSNEKYLDCFLKFGYHVYETKEVGGEVLIQGKWGVDSENGTLILHNGMFEGNMAIEYNILELTEKSLMLESYSTLDTKDSFQEFHFTRVN